MLRLEDLTVRLGGSTIVDRVSLDVARGEVLCLLGPSGSGKSTLLRTMAGVTRPSGGRVLIDGNEVAGPGRFVEPEHRHVGMVFQDYALFPHLTIGENVAFGLKRRERAGAQALLERLGLGHRAKSYPHELSGGERQRAALARAMAPQPRALLMDEPFSSLDSRLRDEVRRSTLELVRASGITTIIVTHDPDEALRIADRVALLDGGRLVQVGTPDSLYDAPRTLFAARFFSDIAVLPGRVANQEVVTPLGRFPAPGFADGTEVMACVRPSHLRVAAEPTPIAARVVRTEYRGDCRYLLVEIEGIDGLVALSARCGGGAGGALTGGDLACLEVDTDAVPVVPMAGTAGTSAVGPALPRVDAPAEAAAALRRPPANAAFGAADARGLGAAALRAPRETRKESFNVRHASN